MDAVCRCGRARLSHWFPLARIRPLPRSPGDRSCRSVLEPPSPRSLVHSHASPPLCCWSVSVCNHARANSAVEHTSAVSTVTVHGPCDQPSSSPRATSSRSPCITRSSCSSSSPGNPLPLCTRSGSRPVQSSFGNTSAPGRKHYLPLSPHQQLTSPCS